MKSVLRLALLSVVVSCFAVGAVRMAVGQAVNYSSHRAAQGTAIRLNVHASGNKVTCKPAPPPVIKVIEPPKFGTFTVRRGQLNTDKLGQCPRVKLPAQVVFYKSRVNFVGKDRLVYGTTSANGQREVFDITIEVKAGPKSTGGKKSNRI